MVTLEPHVAPLTIVDPRVLGEIPITALDLAHVRYVTEWVWWFSVDFSVWDPVHGVPAVPVGRDDAELPLVAVGEMPAQHATLQPEAAGREDAQLVPDALGDTPPPPASAAAAASAAEEDAEDA